MVATSIYPHTKKDPRKRLPSKPSLKPLPPQHIKKDLRELSQALKVTIKKPQDLERIDTLDLLKEQKATELLIKMYLNILAKEEDDLLMLLIALDLI